MMEIKILGSGCKKCQETKAVVDKVIAELGCEANIEKEEDFAKIASYGVMQTPAVVVNGKVKIVGKVPTPAEVMSVLEP